MTGFGYKQITKENWIIADRISASFIQSPGPDTINKGEAYLDMILKPILSERVPIEIIKLFEVARGAIAYGYFFYPLFTLGLEQLFRVGEAAITFRYKLLGSNIARHGFKSIIDELFKHKILTEDEKNRWHALRILRNCASHPDNQSIFAPGQVIRSLSLLAEDINRLFDI